MSRTLNRTVIFWVEDEGYHGMLKNVQRILPGLIDKYRVIWAKPPSDTLITPFPKPCTPFDDPKRMSSINDTLLHLSGMFYQSWKFFPNMRKEILSFLVKSKHGFNFNLPESSDDQKITCIHTRRGDFIEMKRFIATPSFIRNSVNLILEREKGKEKDKASLSSINSTLVIFGDDPKFMSSIFPSTASIFVSSNSPHDDLLYSSQHCDIVFSTAPSSTFGWWMGYLSKGNKVYYTDPMSVNEEVFTIGCLNVPSFFPTHWTPLKLSNDTVIVSRR